MLVLTRGVGEEVTVEGGIRFRILEIRGNSKVRVGIIAPDSVSITRSELETVPDIDDSDLDCIGVGSRLT